MKIDSFRVRKFRNIEDSGQINLLDRLTCIIGKNQAGKTALLRALHKFNPHTPDPYDIRREWPRGQRTSRNSKQVVCEVQFELVDEEIEHLSQITNQTIKTTVVIITKDYEGNFEIRFPEQTDLIPDSLHPNDIDTICGALPIPNKPVGAAFETKAEECIEEAKRFAREGRFEELLKMRERHLESLKASFSQGNPQPQFNNENQFINAYGEKIQEIKKRLGEQLTIHQRAQEYLVSRIPTFIYMDDYRSFRGNANLQEIKRKQDDRNMKLAEAEETFLMILKLSGLNLDQLISQGSTKDTSILHDRQLDLEDAGTTLTKQVSGRWGQNPYRIEFRVDGQTFFTDIEEQDKEIGMIPLEEQSKGFQWFFSFDLHFMHDSEGTFAGCVLLLDEPGLHLHPGGQEDLLKRLDAYAEKNMLIYTTHLPFLVDLREPSRIKVLNQTDDGAVISEDLGSSQPQEKLTLQAALGMRANQSYLVSDQNLVVEGIEDYWIVTELSNLLQRSGRAFIPSEVMVTAAGGASEAVPLSTFMIGQGLQVVTLFDSDNAGRTAEEKLRTKWIIRYKESKSCTYLLGDIIGSQGDFTIEDLFPAGYYLEKTRESHQRKLKGIGRDANDLNLSGQGTILERVERACNDLGIKFNKGSVAKLIRRDLIKMTKVDELQEGVAEKAEKLMTEITKAFGSIESD